MRNHTDSIGSIFGHKVYQSAGNLN